MEEAEYLADRIGIMSHGQLMTSGTSIELRKLFGNGYKLRFITLPENTDSIKNAISEHLPESQFVNANAGSITYTISPEFLTQVSDFFNLIVDDEILSGSILDWGISHSCKLFFYFEIFFVILPIFLFHTALEEVFHNVTALSPNETEQLQHGELLLNNDM